MSGHGLVRERLLRVIDRADVTFVVAPAGAGKTTVLQQFVHSCPGQATWYRTTPDDVDPARFRCRMLALASTEATYESRSAAPVLVIDDCQAIVGSPAEAELERMIVGRRAGTRVLIASRQRPTMNVSRAEFGTVALLSAEDLRFRTWEAEDLFRHVYRDPLLPHAAAALTRRTEGWAAGLHMFQLSTKGCSPAERDSAIEALVGRSRVLQSYLARNVVGELPAELQRFMRRTCVFEVLTSDRCDRLLQTGDSRNSLRELERLQALTTSDDGGRTYRYHEILRQHLAAALQEELGTSDTAHWHLRAATLLEADGAINEAVRLYVRADRWADAARLLRAGGRRFAGVAAQSPAWWDWLPRSIVDQDPWLSVAMARKYVASGRLRAGTERYRHAESLFTDHEQRGVVARERRVVETWLGQPGQPSSEWVGRLRSAVGRSPLAGAVARVETPGDLLARAVSALLAGHIGEARRTLLWSDRSESAFGPIAAGLRFCDIVVGVLAGEDVAEATDRLAGEAERTGITLIERQCRSLAALFVLDADTVRRVREECDAAEDKWGALIATAAEAMCRLVSDQPASANWDEVAARSRTVGSETAEAWALAFGAAAARIEQRDNAMELCRQAETVARTVGVPGARVIALLALGSAEHARSLAGEIAMPWPKTLAQRLIRTRPSAAALESVQARRTDVHVRCLQSFDIRVGDRLLDWRSLRPRAATTLRLLSIHAGHPVHRDTLLDSLWPDLAEAQARQNLQVTVSMLRKFLEPDSARGCAEILLREGEAYRLVLRPGASSDVVDFTHHLDDARDAQRAKDPDRQCDALARAVHTYRGDLLPEDGTAEWVLDERDRLHSQAAAAAATLAELEAARGDHGAAIAAAQRGLEIDSFIDRSWRVLIASYEEIGDCAAAERCRRQYIDVLTELGITPDTFTVGPAVRGASGVLARV